MASLLKSLSNMIRGKKDELARKMADPVRDGTIAIEDSEKQIAEFTERIARLVAESRRLQKQRDEAVAEADKFTRIAQKAAQAGNEDDVRAAVEMKTRAQQRVQSLGAEVERNEGISRQLRDQLAKARAKVAQAKSNMTSLSARMEGAKVRRELAKASSEFNAGKSPLAALDDLDRAVQSEESQAEAWEEMVGAEEANSAESLAEKYNTSSPDVEDEVSRMMAEARQA
jgi:phage shock protein A